MPYAFDAGDRLHQQTRPPLQGAFRPAGRGGKGTAHPRAAAGLPHFERPHVPRGLQPLRKNLSLFTSDEKLTADAQTAEISDLASPELDSYIGAKFAEQLRSDVELVEGVYDEFDREAYLRGELAPVFFGSAVNNFGVRELLECFVRIAPSPRPAPTATRTVEPAEPKMTGFVFKIHANMDPNHRDRIAFLKICSGTFERNHNYLHVRSGKQLKFSSPTAFMAEKKSVIDFAYPGRHRRPARYGQLQDRRHLHRGREAQIHGHPVVRPRAVPLHRER